jgi:hypothetical protein
MTATPLRSVYAGKNADRNPSTNNGSKTHRLARSSRSPVLKLPRVNSEATAMAKSAAVAAVRAGFAKNTVTPPEPTMASPRWTPVPISVATASLSVSRMVTALRWLYQ